MNASMAAESHLDPPDWPAWFDGEFLRAEDVAIPARSPWALYGESVFETIAVVEGELGFEREHRTRLERAAQSVLQREVDGSEVFGAARELAGRIADPDLALRVTLAGSERGGLHRLVQARPLRRFGTESSGVSLFVPGGERADLARGGPSGFKHGARLGLRLARRAALDQGAFDAALLGLDGRPACGTVGNLVVLQGGELSTPPLASGALPGIARAALLSARDEPVRVVERSLTRGEWEAAEGLWLVGSVLGVAPVTAVRSSAYSENPLSLDLPGSRKDPWGALQRALASAERASSTKAR